MNILKLEDVFKAYTNHIAVDKVSFEMPKGSIFGLLGPNGAGKTSLIRIITCITRADSGIVYFDGEPLNQNHPSQIGYMPEERGLYKKMKVGEQLKYLAELKGMSRKESDREIGHWMEKFHIEDWYNKKIEELSKGMQQKIQFISTVLHRPKLLILDEPFSGLDPINTNLIKDEIYALNQSGISVIFSTHRMESVEEICQYMVLINRGKKVLDGKVHEVKDMYKENMFDIHFEGDLQQEWLQEADVISQTEGSVRVKTHNVQEVNALLARMIDKGLIIHGFKELLPSINDIFIKKVRETSGEEVVLEA
jgi:ABC-2 type transport system ATP-binding protein